MNSPGTIVSKIMKRKNMITRKKENKIRCNGFEKLK
jgi:hypothetical protein